MSAILQKGDYAIGLLMMLLLILVISPRLGMINEVRADTYASEWKWTLLTQAHAPKYGKTEITTTNSYEIMYVIGSQGSESRISHGVTLLPNDGQCIARFQMALWQYHLWYFLWIPIEEWTIISTQEWRVTYNIYGYSAYTCEDDLESINYAGCNSVQYAARYVSIEGREDNPSGAWYYVTRTELAGEIIQEDVTVTVGVPGVGMGVGVYHLKNTATTEWVYRYWFGPGYSWLIDYLDYKQNLWVFKIVPLAC